MKQKTFNKIIVMGFLFLTFIVLAMRITEQKRVDFYICYEQIDSMMNLEHDEIVERCEARLREE